MIARPGAMYVYTYEQVHMESLTRIMGRSVRYDECNIVLYLAVTQQGKTR